MAANTGTKIVDDGLVFHFDLENEQRSWRGKPTTNFVEYHDFGISKGQLTGWSITDQNEISTEVTEIYGEKCIKMTRIGGTTGYEGLRSVSILNVQPNTLYTITLEYYLPEGMDQYLRFYIPQRDSSGTVINWNHHISLRDTPSTDGWTSITRTFTTSNDPDSTFTYVHIDWNTTASTTDDTIYLKSLQVEEGNVSTRPVEGTRTNQDTVLDISPNKNVITANNLTYQSGTYPTFDGTDDYITSLIPSSPVYCLEFWMYNNNAIIGDQSIGGPSTYQTPIVFNEQYPLGVSLGGWTHTMTDEKVHIWNGNSSTYTREPVNVGWHHLVFNWNGTSYDIWMDGVQQQTYNRDTYGGAGLITNVTSIRIGGPNSPSYYFYGKIPSVKVYNRALTADEVKKNFVATRGRYGI